MATPAPVEPVVRYTVERYSRLVEEGVLSPDERVELLEGVIVGMAPHSPRHAAGISCAGQALRVALEDRAAVREQLTLVLGPYSAPEPDIAVVFGRVEDYYRAHPRAALLVVEVAETSLAADRLTKAPIYASARIPEYWIIDLRHDRIEVFRDPDRKLSRYGSITTTVRGERLELLALPGVSVAVDDLIPAR